VSGTAAGVPGIPDPAALVQVVLREARSTGSGSHGPDHWRSVAWTGLHLTRHLPLADPVVVALFGLLHDAGRIPGHGSDPDHGPRALPLARSIAESGLIRVEQRQLALLMEAIARHSLPTVSAEPTIGACFDADRLNLWRQGLRPDSRLLSTEHARRPATVRWAKRVHQARRAGSESGLNWSGSCRSDGPRPT